MSGLCVLFVALMLNSCYTSDVFVGKMKSSTPAVKVNTYHNSHFICGLIGTGKARGKDYVEGANDYKARHQITFTDYLISMITFGIYTPSTTKFYLPLQTVSNNGKASKKKASKKKSSKDEEDEED